MTRADLQAKYEKRREEYERLGVLVNGARLCAEVARDLDALASAEDAAVLTLEEAANRSGYSVEHLARQVRRSVIPNAGRKGAPRICASDLPRKPAGSVAAGPRKTYDPFADARSLASRRKELAT